MGLFDLFGGKKSVSSWAEMGINHFSSLEEEERQAKILEEQDKDIIRANLEKYLSSDTFWEGLKKEIRTKQSSFLFGQKDLGLKIDFDTLVKVCKDYFHPLGISFSSSSAYGYIHLDIKSFRAYLDAVKTSDYQEPIPNSTGAPYR